MKNRFVRQGKNIVVTGDNPEEYLVSACKQRTVINNKFIVFPFYDVSDSSERVGVLIKGVPADRITAGAISLLPSSAEDFTDGGMLHMFNGCTAAMNEDAVFCLVTMNMINRNEGTLYVSREYKIK